MKIGPLADDIDALAEIFYNAAGEYAGPAVRLMPGWAVLDDSVKKQFRAGVLAVRDAILPEGSK